MKTNRGLGRGLNALFMDTEEAYENAAKTPAPAAAEFLDWVLSPEGQALMEETGYVGVS